MKIRFPRPTPSMAIGLTALFVALGGTSYAAMTANNAKHLGGAPPSFYLQYRHFAYSHGEAFIKAGQTVTLGRNGHFTFFAACSKDGTGQNKVSFEVRANTTADLDGGGPVPAGTDVVIHRDSDALDRTAANPLSPGAFAQVASASSSTEIASDGQQADVFYNDGVNWPAGNGSSHHDCFAGYNGWIAGLPGVPGLPG